MRNTEDLTAEWIKDCKKKLQRLRRTRLAANWRGGMWALEVTNEGRGWHVHFHLLIDAHWIDAKALAIQWGKLVGQEFAIVKVKDCRQGDYLREVTKYAVKGSQLAQWSGYQIATFVLAIKGGRTFGVFGSLYGKRTEWKAWLDSLAEHHGTCECGCREFWIYDHNEWQARELKRELSGRSGIPPPPIVEQASRQIEIRLNV